MVWEKRYPVSYWQQERASDSAEISFWRRSEEFP